MLHTIRRLLRGRTAHPTPTFRPTLERLEERSLLSANVLQTNLVSDLPGVAAVLDPNLVNPWGIAESAKSPFWISDNNAGLSTLYNVPGANNAPVGINPLVVSIPTPADPTGGGGDFIGGGGAPTGAVFNGGGGFQISDGTHTGSAAFLFATEDGTIVGWSAGVDPTGKFAGPNGLSEQAVIAVDNSGNNFTNPNPDQQTGAVYKGIAIGTDASGQTLLYASNFRAGTIDVFDTNFKPVKNLPTGAFTDPNLPKGYAPFDVQVLGGKVYVTYALQNDAKHDDVAGPGHGFVDVFNLDGTPGLAGGKVRLASRGALNSPWGLAIAPAGFGSLGGDLLVGNFGDGHINVFNPTTGAFLGQLKDPDGEPIQIDGLWGLRFGNGGAGGDANTLYFTAGLDHEMHGLFGSLTAVKAGTPEGPAEAQVVQADLDVVQLNLTVVQSDLTNNAPKAQLRQDIQTLDQSFIQLARDEVRFRVDTFADLGIGGSHHQDGDDLFAG